MIQINSTWNSKTMHIIQSSRLKTSFCLSCYSATLLLSAQMAAAQADTNAAPLPKELLSPQMAWGEETNGIRAGVDWGLSDKMSVRVVVLSFKTNETWLYVAPPGKEFRTFELRDARGVLLAPLNGKKLDGELPQQILAKNLPYRPASGIHHRKTLDNWLLIGYGQPVIFRDVDLQDVYQIAQEGDYTLTVCVAIYRFAPDQQSVLRIDLPPVTMKIHLK
jgi:hypothetical protein